MAVAQIAAKALQGCVFVLLFALPARTLHQNALLDYSQPHRRLPHRQPAHHRWLQSPDDAHRAGVGMLAGAAGFILYWLLAPPPIKRFGSMRGSALFPVAWARPPCCGPCYMAPLMALT